MNTILWSKIGFFSILLFYSTYVSSQGYTFRPGINLGLNSSQVSGDDLSGFDQFGFYGGILVSQEITEHSSLQFQIAFSQKGSRKPSDPQNNAVYVIRLNYIDVSMIFTTHLLKKRFNNILGEIGIVNSYLINYTERNLYGNVTPVRPFHKYELSGMLGLGYEINENIHFSLRYFNSILPIRKHVSNTTYLWNRGQYNSVAQLSVIFYMPMKSPTGIYQ